jgi:hypothetical protein
MQISWIPQAGTWQGVSGKVRSTAAQLLEDVPQQQGVDHSPVWLGQLRGVGWHGVGLCASGLHTKKEAEPISATKVQLGLPEATCSRK